ncbi:MAG: DUF362 domain-containing protein [Bacteroidales bacterium]|nr:DUF362 domain-containing protein [Bacteroidales bacterium]
MENRVYVKEVSVYDENKIYQELEASLFQAAKTAKKVVLKPNWVRDAHLDRPGHWDYVITHPAVISAVLRKVLDVMPSGGRISIIDGPEFSSSFEKLMSYYPVSEWKINASQKNIDIEIIDLRDEIWEDDGNVVTKRTKNTGDFRGSTQVDLYGEYSEFYGHKKSKKGYYGADSNIAETNRAHNGLNNLYRVSKTVIECDLFINLPKLKTHKKSGITCSLKNLVGINTYRNYLPHCSLGLKEEGGDQFFLSGTKQKIEGKLMPLIHQHIRTSPALSRLFSPIMSLGKKIFGNNKQTIRGGAWYGNDTIWRMIIDINKVLLYSNPDGSLKPNSVNQRKKYLTIVDAILCGEGNGPKIPDPKNLNYIIQGENATTVDAVCSELMGFNYNKIPIIKNSFNIRNYPITTCDSTEIIACFEDGEYSLENIPENKKSLFIASNGWIHHIER